MSKKHYDILESTLESRINALDQADAAFWDEFYSLDSASSAEDHLYTISITDETTGEKRIIKHVRLGGIKSKTIL